MCDPDDRPGGNQRVVTQHTDLPFEVFTIDGALSEMEIDALSAFVDARCNRPVRDREFTNSSFVNGKLLLPDLAASFRDAISDALPAVYTDAVGTRWTGSGASRYIFYARMVPGNHFGIHTDTGSVSDDATNTISKHTVLLYLNDDFEGGDTSFFTDTFHPLCRITPKRGRILVFDIDRYHMGESVKEGVKKWFGIELVSTSS